MAIFKQASYEEAKHFELLVFWLSHFKSLKSVSLDLFKTHLEEYSKTLVPMNGNLQIEIVLSKFRVQNEVNYFSDFNYLLDLVPR